MSETVTVDLIDSPVECKCEVYTDGYGNVQIEVTFGGVSTTVGLKPASARSLAERILAALDAED